MDMVSILKVGASDSCLLPEVIQKSSVQKEERKDGSGILEFMRKRLAL